ncbi:LysR family transcriptional regulator [Acidisoma cellulosilytica]|uniref:LysR family transcriptional regulator n=1 Tax=Acidisoma cellulosilyticum TaxID=2802395 RepID=A0A964E504_9PROT|nr:LysR family transcriptional regulator [Acidisoma cellulosilyticum]MCB8881912.1 LysR family transcriptional regulator [Acidisoma cellulosilyticum]
MTRIDLLRSFVILGEAGNYTIAADRLGISQPTLTKQIARLEDILGQLLFHRSRQGTELTDFGRQFLVEAQPLVREADRIWARGLRMAAGQTGQLAIGFTFSALEVMTRALIAYRETFPDVEISFDDISSQSQLPMLREHRLDVAFARLQDSPDLSSCIVSSDRLAFVFPAERAGEIESIDSPAVRHMPFIRLKHAIAPGFEGAVQRLFEWKGIEPAVTHWVNESLVQLRMVAAGLGVAIMHGSAVSSLIDRSRLVVQPIDGPDLGWQTAMYWRSTEKKPVVLQFLKIAEGVAASFQK